jgi:hypothetical protein
MRSASESLTCPGSQGPPENHFFYLGWLSLVAYRSLNSLSIKAKFLCLQLTSVAYDHIQQAYSILFRPYAVCSFIEDNTFAMSAYYTSGAFRRLSVRALLSNHMSS